MIGLADTSVFIATEDGRPLGAGPAEMAVSVVTIGELRLGVLMADDLEARSRRLATLQVAGLLEPIPIDEQVAEAWSELVASMRREGRRIPLNDSWIAATALARGMSVVTQDSDFDDVPGLDVVRV